MAPSSTPSSQIAVFLDRDGTLNEERGYIRELENLVLIPGAANAIKRLNDAGILAILTTNQTGAARNYYGEDHILALNERVQTLLKEEAGAHLDAIYYSPYLEVAKGTPEMNPKYIKDTSCRKPGIGMIEWACRDFPAIDVSQSYVVGDKATDVEMAHNAHCHGILLKTGYGERVLAGEYQSIPPQPFIVASDISEAVKFILSKVRATITP